MNRNHSVVFEFAPQNYIPDSCVDYEGYSISSMGFLPTVVDIMVTWVKFAIPVHFGLLIPKMFTVAESCLTTSNLPWFMDLTFQVPMQYYSSQHQALLSSPFTSTSARHIHTLLSPQTRKRLLFKDQVYSFVSLVTNMFALFLTQSPSFVYTCWQLLKNTCLYSFQDNFLIKETISLILFRKLIVGRPFPIDS